MAHPLTHLTHGIPTRRPFHPAKTASAPSPNTIAECPVKQGQLQATSRYSPTPTVPIQEARSQRVVSGSVQSSIACGVRTPERHDCVLICPNKLRFLFWSGSSPMGPVVALLIFGTLLAACSGSNRAEGIVPAWANTTPPRAAQYVADKNHVEGRSQPDARPQQAPRAEQAPRPQEAEKPVARSLHEE